MTSTSTDDTTATDQLRKALRSRHLNIANIAHELAVPATTLEAFVDGKATLPTATLQALCDYLFGGNVIYDETINRFRSGNKTPAIPLAPARPPPFSALPERDYPPRWKPEQKQARLTLPPAPPQPKRPGWV